MSAEDPQISASEPLTTQGRVIRDYFKPVSKHTLLIILIIVLAFVGALLISLLGTGTIPYEAEALVFFTPGASSQADLLSADPQFRNVAFDATRQQRNVVLLMSTVDIAKDVQQRAATSSDSAIATIASKSPLAVYNDVQVQIKGDFISVKAAADTAARATWLANNWAEVGVSTVNKAYAQPSSNVNQALDEARTQLDTNQKALEDFLADNRINSVTQELTRTQSFIAAAVDSSVKTDIVLRDAESESIRARITENYSTTATLNRQLDELAALRTRIQQSPEDQGSLYSNQIALTLLLNRVVGGDSANSIQLQVNLTSPANGTLSKSSQLSDLDSTVTAVQQLQADTASQTTALENRLRSPEVLATPDSSNAISLTLQTALEQQGKLESELEQLQSQKSRLEKTRDLSQTTYDLLRSRLAEQNVNVVVSSIVDIGSAADEAQTAQSRSVGRSVVLVTGEWVLLALAIGILLAYLLNALWPDFNSNDIFRGRMARGGQRSARVNRSG